MKIELWNKVMNQDKIKNKVEIFDDVILQFVENRKKVELDGVSKNNYWESLNCVVDELYNLAEHTFDVLKFDLLIRESSIELMVNHAYEKISNFDPSKGRAFNYFTIVMLNMLRKQYRLLKTMNMLANGVNNA